MRNFKIVDFWISAILIALFAVAVVISRTKFVEPHVWGYVVVGVWQGVSMVVHTVYGYFMKRWGARYLYHWVSVAAVITMTAGNFRVVYYAAPFMAIYYTWLCYKETFLKMKRPLDLLK